MPRHQWTDLNKQQVGAFAEYFVKMELTMYGFQVYGSEVDDRGVDFVACLPDGPFLKIQVKALRAPGYLFMRKAHFRVDSPGLYLALVLMFKPEPPVVYLVPATAWRDGGSVFVGRDCVGLKSEPEWGLTVNSKTMAVLALHECDAAVQRLRGGCTG